VLGRCESDGGFDEVEFGLNFGDALELHVKDRLLVFKQFALLLNQIPLLTDFGLKRSDASRKCEGHRAFSPLASVDGNPGLGLAVQRSETLKVQLMAVVSCSIAHIPMERRRRNARAG
jgi:hypothetical protein